MPATVILVDALPGDSAGAYAHYDNRQCGGRGWTVRDIRAVVAECQEGWMAQLDGWHHELCRAGAARSWHWWLLPASRLTAWYPVDLKPLLFSLGVVECLRRQPAPILYLVGVPDEVRQYLDERRAQGEGSVVIDQRRVRTRFNAWRARATRSIRPLMDALVGLRSVVVRAMLRRTPDGVGGRARLLVLSHTLTVSVMRRSGDHFFGHVFDQSSLRDAGDIQWLYHLSLFQERDAVREFARSVGRRISFDFDWLRWIDIWRVVVDAIGLRLRMRSLDRDVPPLAVGGLRTTAFPRLFVAGAVSGYVPIAELATYRSVKRCLRQIQPASVLYPYEQKGLERAVLRACAEHSSPIRTIAFAHAVSNKGHRYLRYCGDLDQPSPDLIGTTGPSARQWMIDWAGWEPSRLLLLGSPLAAAATRRPRTPHPGPLRVLLLVGYGTELEQLASFAEAQPDLFAGCELMVRRYPYAWHEAQDRGLRRLADAGVRLSVDAQELDQQIAWADVVLFCSTSAGIEAILQGRVVIRVGLDDIFDADPTEAKGDAGAVVRCWTPAELTAALATVADGTPESYDARVERQLRFAERIYAPFDASALG